MIQGHVFIATSLDGFIARPDGALDWLLPYSETGEDHGYEAFMAGMDGLVMGSGTYESVLAFPEWPYRKPVVVLTRRHLAVPSHLKGRVRFSAAGPRTIMEELTREGWRNVYVDGGQVVQAFLREGLIEMVLITRVPILLGQGRPLFGETAGDVRLEHLETKAFPSGLSQSRYRVLAR